MSFSNIKNQSTPGQIWFALFKQLYTLERIFNHNSYLLSIESKWTLESKKPWLDSFSMNQNNNSNYLFVYLS